MDRPQKKSRSRKLTFDPESITYKVPVKESETRDGLGDIAWNRIRNKDTKKLAKVCLFDILKYYNVQDESDLNEREFLDEDIRVIKSCLSVIDGLKPMPWQLRLIQAKYKEVNEIKKLVRLSEMDRILEEQKI